MTKKNNYITAAISGLGCFLNVAPDKGLQNTPKYVYQLSGFVCVLNYILFQSQSTSESVGATIP